MEDVALALISLLSFFFLFIVWKSYVGGQTCLECLVLIKAGAFFGGTLAQHWHLRKCFLRFREPVQKGPGVPRDGLEFHLQGKGF